MPKISIFRNYNEPGNPEYIEFLDFLEKTRDGEWEDIVNKCRNIKDKDERDAFKGTMPGATFSGDFKYRNEEGLLKHSGFINIDLDHVENLNVLKRTLTRDKYVFAVFMSTSGDGLRVVFKINPDKHREAFKGIAAYIYETYGEAVDPNGVSLSKPYVVSFDPGTYIDYDNKTEVFRKYIKETPIKRLPDFVHTTGDFDNVIRQITGRGINICESYSDWLRVGLAIAEQFGADGAGYFHEISRMSLKYKYEVCEKQYKYCIRARGTGEKANISTVYYLAKSHGVNISTEQTRTIVRTTRTGKKSGLSKEKVIENLKKFSSIEGADELVKKVYEADYEEQDEEESILHGLEMYISNNYSIRMNEVTGYLEQNGASLSPSYLNTIFISAKKILPKLDYPLMMRLLKSDFIPSYNPFFEFFGSDGIAVELPATPKPNKGFESPLIDKLSKTIKNDNPLFTETFLRKWIVSIVSSAHKVHSPLLFCLLGKQNSGKTEWFRRLLPNELKMYYAESKLDKGKDDELVMTENILVMDDELGGKSKRDALKINNITSVQWFTVRRPYGDQNEKILRLAVLCGTSNYLTVLTDPTGNRRIIPVEVQDIDKELYNSIDKKELFLEAYRLYKEGFDWRVTVNDIPILNRDQHKYQMVMKEVELINKYFAPGEDAYLSSTDIMVEIELLTRQKLGLNSIGEQMNASGFDKKSIRYGKFNERVARMWGVSRINRTGVNDIYTNSSVNKPKEDLPF